LTADGKQTDFRCTAISLIIKPHSMLQSRHIHVKSYKLLNFWNRVSAQIRHCL